MATRDADALWAITAYWNPLGWTRRRANYRRFRDHMRVPLVAVELAQGRGFELRDDDAEVVLRLRGGTDILWQKERLLNLALRALPPSCRKVAWVDCDVIFEASDWVERTSALLEDCVLVQPFGRAHWMPRDWAPGRPRPPGTASLDSVPLLVAAGRPCLNASGTDSTCAPGFAWAADRGVLEAHGLYDACILGGADSAIVRAAYGAFEDAARMLHMDARRREHFFGWARPFHAAIAGRVGYAEGDLFHLWHGDVGNRDYVGRHARFSRFAFDPLADITDDSDGAWRWNSAKPEMHAYVRDYFASRLEDG